MPLNPREVESFSETIDKYKQEFLKELDSGEWKEERNAREKKYQELFSKEHIKDIDEKEFKDLFTNLWSTSIWGNKEYYVNKLIDDNGVEKLRNEFNELLYGSIDFKERYTNFHKNIKGLGSAAITEIISFVQPKKYTIWNSKPKRVLPLIGLSKALPESFFKFQISKGESYIKCLGLMKELLDISSKKVNKELDYIDLDILVWILFKHLDEIATEIPGSPIEEEKQELKKELVQDKKLSLNDLVDIHADVEGILLRLGKIMGYATYTPDKSKLSTIENNGLGEIATKKSIDPEYMVPALFNKIRNIDVIWFNNEGRPKYCFEVEHTTDVTKGLLRLYQLEEFKDITFFIIGPQEVESKFEKEVSMKPFNQSKERYIFKSYKSIIDIYNKSFEYSKARDDFFLK